MCDLKIWKVITYSSELQFGVLRFYGNPIESSFHLDSFGWQWVLEFSGMGRSGR